MSALLTQAEVRRWSKDVPPLCMPPAPVTLRWFWRSGNWIVRLLVCAIVGHSPVKLGSDLYVCRDCEARAVWRFL